jgi:hypothetical protein
MPRFTAQANAARPIDSRYSLPGGNEGEAYDDRHIKTYSVVERTAGQGAVCKFVFQSMARHALVVIQLKRWRLLV